jgi:uncharacterized phage-associated protein
MFSHFDLDKTMQAVGVLLKTSTSSRMSRLRLLKLLYIAERGLLKDTGRMMTGDRAVAMDHGPVLTSTYNLIKGQHADAKTWDEHFLREGAHDVRLIRDPGNGDLSRFEVTRLEAVAAEFEAYDDWALSEYTHKFAEWKANKPAAGSRNPIPVGDVLKAVNQFQRKSDLRRDVQSLAAVEKIVSGD